MTLRPIRLMLALLITLPGCSAISALDQAATPLEVYELRALAPSGAAPARRDVEVIVEEPIASGALATERIMIRPAPLQAQYLPGVRWADPAPAMIQTLLLRSLAETGAFTSVGRRPVGALADYAILGELTDFQAETGADEAVAVRVRLMLRAVREADGRVVASRTFEATGPAASAAAPDVVSAFDAALATMLADAVPWVLSSTRR